MGTKFHKNFSKKIVPKIRIVTADQKNDSVIGNTFFRVVLPEPGRVLVRHARKPALHTC